ncbi:hypothetical protein [Actinoplanes flavus]|uniref:hypothetical protein n=1 Tax=Actinoplanes flavus TaxID=2820290 RepID=UPI001EE5727B|nr:hypothetical protein [Actinoplanes flavus]
MSRSVVRSTRRGYVTPPEQNAGQGHRGWLGVRLDRDPDWSEIAELCQDAFRAVAPKTLVARLDGA